MFKGKINPKRNSEVEKVLELSKEKIDDCMQCGKCSAGCPANAGMDVLPHQVIRFLQIGDVEKLRESKSIWNCAACFTCESRCPRNVSVSKLMEAVRQTVVRKQGEDRLTPEFVAKIMQDRKMPQQAVVSGFRKYTK
ncbi:MULTISPECIES: 4Fe-4S dicluster domain-containing protein [unclassified Cetobacterium]|uniref:4Fe-4S dicluster domain-containing protein n=1 Tax=unclassified Cetobacterium TaxID=2630983 RepID=UPI00068D7F01|nr:4Fe-4S dicluster domain-containing protein [Cetobacterium sp. ZOR0034]